MSTTRPIRIGRRTLLWVIGLGLAACMAMAGVVAYYASPHPDGLESVAEQEGFADNATDSATVGSPLADYSVTAVEDERVSVGLAGLAGVVVTGAVAFGLFRLLRAGRPGTEPPDRG